MVIGDYRMSSSVMIGLSILKKYPGEWETCAKEIRGSMAVFDAQSPCWQEFNARRKVFVKPRKLGDTTGWPSVEDIRTDLRRGNCCGGNVE